MGFVEARIQQTPRWLGGVPGYAYQEGLGAAQDEELATLKVAAKLRAPYPISPVDALDMQGQECRILRAPGEADEAYAARLRNKHSLWYWAGTTTAYNAIFAPFAPAGMDTPPTFEAIRLDAATQYDLINTRRARLEPVPEIVHVHTAGASSFVYVFDGPDEWISLVSMIVDSTTGPWDLDGDWDDPWDWDDGGLWETTMTMLEAKYIRQMVRRWKAHQAYPTHVAIALPGADLWDMDGAWDDGGNWTDTDPPQYLILGHVWGEEALDGSIDIWDDPGDWDAFVDPLAVP